MQEIYAPRVSVSLVEAVGPREEVVPAANYCALQGQVRELPVAPVSE